jgi:hypothetical protein
LWEVAVVDEKVVSKAVCWEWRRVAVSAASKAALKANMMVGLWEVCAVAMRVELWVLALVVAKVDSKAVCWEWPRAALLASSKAALKAEMMVGLWDEIVGKQMVGKKDVFGVAQTVAKSVACLEPYWVDC